MTAAVKLFALMASKCFFLTLCLLLDYMSTMCSVSEGNDWIVPLTLLKGLIKQTNNKDIYSKHNIENHTQDKIKSSETCRLLHRKHSQGCGIAGLAPRPPSEVSCCRTRNVALRDPTSTKGLYIGDSTAAVVEKRANHLAVK